MEAVDHDLSRAVVRVAQPEMSKLPRPAAEIASFGNRAVIVVTPSLALERRAGVLLVPLSDGRALISFDESMTPARLELRIQDALEDPELAPADILLCEAIRDLLKDVRRSTSVSLRRRQIMVLERIDGKNKRKQLDISYSRWRNGGNA